MNFYKIWSFLCEVNWIKTIYFNLKYFPLRIAAKLPVFVYFHTRLEKLGGVILIDVPVRPAMLKIGPHGVNTIDISYERTVWSMEGVLVLKGFAYIGRGSRISVSKTGNLIIGNNFRINGRSTIISHRTIDFGSDCLLSWDILVMDTDFHKIYSKDGLLLNEPMSIVIGNHVWIGCRTTILKGSIIPDGCVIAAGSVVSKKCIKDNCVYGGIGNTFTILKDSVNWNA